MVMGFTSNGNQQPKQANAGYADSGNNGKAKHRADGLPP
jgi:hypothetical protein